MESAIISHFSNCLSIKRNKNKEMTLTLVTVSGYKREQRIRRLTYLIFKEYNLFCVEGMPIKQEAAKYITSTTKGAIYTQSREETEFGYKSSKLTLSDSLSAARLCLLKVPQPSKTVQQTGLLGSHLTFKTQQPALFLIEALDFSFHGHQGQLK